MGRCTDMSCGAYLVTVGPTGSIGTPVNAAHWLKLWLESARGDAFEQAHHFGRGKLGRRRDQEMHGV